MDIRVAAYAIITNDDGQILLPHWNEPGVAGGWTLPGGGIDPGEDPADAVVREVFEESGFHAKVDELLGIDSIVIPGENRLRPEQLGTPLHALRIIYRAHITGGGLTVEQGGSTDDVAWFPLHDVAQLQTVSLVEAGLKLAGLDPRS